MTLKNLHSTLSVTLALTFLKALPPWCASQTSILLLKLASGAVVT